MTTIRLRAAKLAAAVLLIAAPMLAADAAAPAPKAVIVTPVYDAGLVDKGVKVVHDFEVRNEGTANLEIRDVRPDCGCTVASFDRVIPPGQVGHVHIELDTASFAGPIAKSATVLTNDPALPSIEVTVKAGVKPPIAVDPGYARFIYVQGAKTGTITQTLWAEDFPDFTVTGAKSPYPFLVTSFHEATEPERNPKVAGRQWRVSLTIQPDAPVGALSDYLVVETNHPRQKTVAVPISGFVRPLFAVTPPTLDVREIVGAERQVFAAAFINYGETAIKIQKVEVTVPGIQATVQELEAGHRFRIRLAMSPEIAKGPFSGTLRISTDNAQMPVFEVPVTGTAK